MNMMSAKSQADMLTSFEALVDCLIYYILKNANLASQNQMFPQVGQPQTESQQLSNHSFDLLNRMVSLPSTDGIDTGKFLSTVSGNASPLTIREKLVRSILHTYSKDVP